MREIKQEGHMFPVDKIRERLAYLQNRSTIDKVKEFHTAFDVYSNDKPSIIPDEQWKLRISLLAEELKELEEGCEKKDMVEIADALTDLQYVLDGAYLAFGMQNIKDELFDHIHESNMSKLCDTPEIAQATKDKYLAEGVVTYIKFDENSGKYMVKRDSDNKVLKSIDYKPADCGTILIKYI